MNLFARLYLYKFSNQVGYCSGMRDYLKEETKKGNLNIKQLKYLYKNLYKKTYYVQQNIFPVSQAMIKGLTIEEIENISKNLLDAGKYTVFSRGAKNYKYNKLFKDLEFMFKKYTKWKKYYSSTMLRRNTFIYTKLLNKAREENKFYDEKIYNYVEENVRNYKNYCNKMKTYKPKGITRHSRYTVVDLNNYKEIEKEMILLE